MPASLLSCLLAASVLANPSGVQSLEELVMTPQGPESVRLLRMGDGRVVEVASCGSVRAVDMRSHGLESHAPRGGNASPQGGAVRWIDDHGGLTWIGYYIDIGDSGAVFGAGKPLNNQSVTLYSATSPQHIFDAPMPDAANPWAPRVAVANRAPRAAVYTTVDINPDPFIFEFLTTVSAYSTIGDGTPIWSYTFANHTGNNQGGGVTISDDGNIVFVWKTDAVTRTMICKTFRGTDGQLLVRREIVLGTEHAGRAAYLSADGRRAYIAFGRGTVVYDTIAGEVEFEPPQYPSTWERAHAISRDGKRIAYGWLEFSPRRTGFDVYEEVSPGRWERIVHEHDFPAVDRFMTVLTMDADGSRVGWSLQLSGANRADWHTFTVGLYDIDSSSHLFRKEFSEPMTEHQVVVRELRLNDAGTLMAGSSWGDSLNTTPEGFVLDEDGSLRCEIDVPGSAFGADLDGWGDLFALGTKSVHANVFGNGGEIIAADAWGQPLMLEGFPQHGKTMTLRVDRLGTSVRLAVCARLGSTMTPWGPTLIDLRTMLVEIGPLSIPQGGLERRMMLPTGAAFAGRDLHIQGVILGGPQPVLTNKVSIRVLP